MGHLIAKGEFGNIFHADRSNRQPGTREAKWYFADRVNPKLEDSYPIRLSIHIDDLEGGRYDRPSKLDAGRTRIEIRKFIERRLDGDVVYEQEPMEHVRVSPPRDNGKRYSDQITHGYYHFHFENENDAFHFKMKFGEIVREPSERHPGFPPEEGYEDLFGRNAHYRSLELTGLRDWW